MKILAPLFRYDYGDPRRGESLEKLNFVPAIAAFAEVYPFWLEEHGFPGDLPGLQAAIIAEAERLDPDLIFFILMENEVYSGTLENLRKRWKTANWFCDDQWRFESFTRNIAPLLSFPITVDKYRLPDFRAIGCENVILSQWASDSCLQDNMPDGFEYEVSFIGGKNLVREWYINELSSSGIHVDCFGAGWENGRVDNDTMKSIVSHSKISLNLTNSVPENISFRRYAIRRSLRALIPNGKGVLSYLKKIKRVFLEVHMSLTSIKRCEQIKARNFEIPAWRGFQLSQFALGVDDYFVPGKEIVLFSSLDELKRLIRYYLENDIERESIRTEGYRRAAEHTYKKRMQEVLERIFRVAEHQ